MSAGRALLALGLCTLAVAGAWLVPGFAGRGIGALVAQQPAAQQRDSTLATVPPARPAPTPTTPTERLT